MKASDDKTPTPLPEDNWAFFAAMPSGTVFAPIRGHYAAKRQNLKSAWTYHTGRGFTGPIGASMKIPAANWRYALTSCTPLNVVMALDADTGKTRWRFDPARPNRRARHLPRVGYWDAQSDDSLSAEESQPVAAAVSAAYPGVYGRRPLIALNAKTGELCDDFGDHGSVDPKQGMDNTENSKRYHPTSTPVIMGHIAVLGGWVRGDIVHGEPPAWCAHLTSVPAKWCGRGTSASRKT